MAGTFRLLSTPSFEREVRALTRRDARLLRQLKIALSALTNDPTNVSRRFDIKKLAGVKRGEGQWRIRLGSYRLRYDIERDEVVLHSFRHRREAY